MINQAKSILKTEFFEKKMSECNSFSNRLDDQRGFQSNERVWSAVCKTSLRSTLVNQTNPSSFRAAVGVGRRQLTDSDSSYILYIGKKKKDSIYQRKEVHQEMRESLKRKDLANAMVRQKGFIAKLFICLRPNVATLKEESFVQKYLQSAPFPSARMVAL